jgi:hypothetical protein
MLYIHYLFGSFCSFVVDMFMAEAEGFLLLAEMGLFVQTGTWYQMTSPQCITPKDAAAAIERLLSAFDNERVSRPHLVIKCMPRSEAEEWQRRLASLSREARLADRRILLGLEPDDRASG